MILDVVNTVSIGGITLGATDGSGVEWYFTSIDGWGATKSSAQITQRAAADGGYSSPAFLSPRTVSVQGAVIAPSTGQLVAAMDSLNAAASIQQQTITVLDSGSTKSILAQRQDEVLWTRVNDIAASFTVSFSCTDPRKFGTPITASTGLPSGSGSWTLPFTVPFSINSTIVTGDCTATNTGNTPGPVTMRISGPVVGPVVTHVASGLQLVFSSSLSLGAGEWIDVDMEARTVLAQGQASRAQYVTSRGWSQFDIGGNTWAFTAASGSGTLSVTATPSFL